MSDATKIVERFNTDCPVGSLVRYWRGVREGDGATGRIARQINGTAVGSDTRSVP